jgi:hypothetical protein
MPRNEQQKIILLIGEDRKKLFIVAGRIVMLESATVLVCEVADVRDRTSRILSYVTHH